MAADVAGTPQPRSFDVQLLSSGASGGEDVAACRRIRGGRVWACLAVVLGSSTVLCQVVWSIWKDKAIRTMLEINDDEVNIHCGAGLIMQNITRSVDWPGCGVQPWTDNCTLPCYPKELPLQIAEFNTEHGGRLLSYPSRPHPDIEGVELRGWYLPARADRVPEGRRAPRVVLQHGFRENSNNWRIVLLSYMLRQCGIDVLANNFRDHCYSDRSSAHMYEWGNAYPYDLLGAWDFARSDPRGEMGGPVDGAHVGVGGFSKGGFTALSVMGVEPRMAAAWVDGSPFLPGPAWQHLTTKFLRKRRVPAWLTRWLVGRTWLDIDRAALDRGTNLSRHTPSSSLPLGPDTRRPLYIIHNRGDATCPMSFHEELMDVLRVIPEKYTVQEGGPWLSGVQCHGNPHCTLHLSLFGEYLGRLCRFWRATFDLGPSECDAIVEEVTRRLPATVPA